MNVVSETLEANTGQMRCDRIPQLIVLVSVCLITSVVLTGQPLQSANDRSRWATVWSLVHRGTWQIDEIDRDPLWSTIDKVRHRASAEAPWHFYSSKPPLLTSIAAGLYWIEYRTLGWDLRHDTLLVTRSLLLVLNALPMALALWLFTGTLRQLKLTTVTYCYILLLAGLGSMLNPYLSTLNNHTPAAVCLLICLTTIVKMRGREPRDVRGREFAAVGLTAALTSCFELPAALFGILSFVWMLRLNKRVTLKWYLPAALVPLTAFLVTNWLVTGGLRPFYAFYGTDRYVYDHLGVPSYWTNPQGIDASHEGPLTYLLHCLIGHHGLFSHTPALLLSLWGWLRMRQEGNRPELRWVLPAGAVLSMAVLTFYLSRPQNYNYGGNTVALRWMLWLLPFWWFALTEPVEHLQKGKPGRLLCGTLLAASVVTSVMSLPQPWRPSWIYGAMADAGWIDYRTLVADFDPPRHAVIADWPAVPDVSAGWVSGLGGDQQRILLRSLGLRNVGDRRAAEFHLSLFYNADDDNLPEIVPLVVLLDTFETGHPVEDWLFVKSERDTEPTPAAELQQAPVWIVRLIRGLPSTRAYNAEGVRWYQRTPESEGTRCETAASRVPFNDPQFGRCWQRCDIWYCEDLPYGVLRWQTKIMQESSGETVQVTTWTSEQIP